MDSRSTRSDNPNLVDNADAFTRTILRIPSVIPQWRLHAWCYLPNERRTPCPVVVMAHGLAGNKLLGLSVYAQAFASAGYGCVVFDYRRWGESDGEPRHCLYVTEQLEDYRTVIKYCRQQPEFDPQRVILWGTSFAGGHVLSLAAEKNLNVSAVIAQCPWLGVGGRPKFNMATLTLLWYSLLDVLKQMLGLGPYYIPVVAQHGEVGALTAPGCVTGYHNLTYDQRDFPNELSASSLFEIPMHQPLRHASDVKCPTLLVSPVHDNLCVHKGAIEFASKCASVELVELDCGHFDIYPNAANHQEALNSELAFLKKVVPV